MDDALATTQRLDSVLSALNHSLMRNGATGMGTSLDPYTQVEVNYGRLLNEQQLRALYRGSWFIRRVVDLLPQDMTKAGVEVLLHDGSNTRIVNKAMQVYHDGGQRQNPYEKRMGCNEARRLALTYARWFGMGYIVLRVNGGENPAKPLTKVKSFEGVSVLDRYSLRPAIGTIDVHNPEFYQVSRHDAPGGFGGELPVMQRIHASRVLPYKGAMIHPYDIQLEGDGGHDSVVQQVYEAFTRHFMAKDAISKGLDSYSLFKVAISGLSTLLQSPNGTQTLTEYLNTVAQQMSLHRILVQDTEASKSEFQERSFAGVAENFKFFVDDLIAATGYPHYKIYGSVGKAGLADSGGAESRAWAETVRAYQSMELADNDRILFHAIFEALGRVPKQWEVVYPSIYSATPEEEATLAKTQADTLTALTREGVITTRQAYQALATGQPLENVLKPLDESDVLTPVEEEAAQGPSAEEELAALLGGDAPATEDAPVEATPVEPEAVEDTPAEAETAEDVPEEVAVDEPLPDAVDEPLEEPLEEDEIATEVEAEVVPDDEPEPLSAEEEMAALLAEEEQQIDAADTFTPPDSARANAQRVLDWRERHGEDVKGMTAVGWTRARQLASGEPISLDIVKRIAQFNRHRQNSKVAPEYKDTPWKDAGHVAWLGWGGTTGIDWAIGVSAKTDAWDDHADADDILEYLVGWRTDAPKGGKKKRTTKPKCTKGRSCGMSCIAMSKRCPPDKLGPAADVVAKSVVSSGGAGGGKGQGGNEDPFSPQVNPINIPDVPKAAPQAAPQVAKPKATSGGIKNPRDFADEVLKIMKRIDADGSLKGRVPIHLIRSEIGQQVTRKEFKKWMLDMQSNNLIQMQKNDNDFTPPKQIEDSIIVPGGNLRFYAVIKPEGDARFSSLENKDPFFYGDKPIKQIKTKIGNLSTFRKEAKRIHAELAEDYNLDNIVPIHRLRAEFGNRLSNSQFNEWLNNAVQEGDFIPGKGDGRDPKNEYNINGLTRYYLSLANKNDSLDLHEDRQNSKVAPEHKDTPWKDAGHVAWLGWGGTTGIDWAIRVSAKADDWDDHADADDILEYLVGWRVDAPKGGTGKSKKKRTTKPKCVKGRSCGMSCIAMSKECPPDKLGPAADVVAKSVASSGGAGSRAKPKAEPKPKAQPKPKAESKAKKASPKASTPKTYVIPTAPTPDMKLLGKGAFGAVYLDEKNNVALKYVTGENPALAQFYSTDDEVRMMQKASDAGVGPRLFGTSQDADGNPIIAMEYLKGFIPLNGTDPQAKYEDLNRLPEKKQARVIVNVLKAIEQMSQAGIIHNDAHTGNIMFNPRTGQVKMVDMGLASEGSAIDTDVRRFIRAITAPGSAWKSSWAMSSPMERFPRIMNEPDWDGDITPLIKQYEDMANG